MLELRERGLQNDTCVLLEDKRKEVSAGRKFLPDRRYIGKYQYGDSDKFIGKKKRFRMGKEIADTIQTTDKEGVVYGCIQVRKLTEREVFRLQGVKDEDFEKVATRIPKSLLYHLAGDSIEVSCLMAIFGMMLDVDWKRKIDDLIEDICEVR